jgi:hypothetical protein
MIAGNDLRELLPTSRARNQGITPSCHRLRFLSTPSIVSKVTPFVVSPIGTN